MFTKIEDFLTNWQHESGSTQKVLDALTDESLAQEVSPQDRTLGRIAWHIVTTLDEMMGRTGLKFEAAPHNAELPNSAREIAEAYRSSSEAMVSAIREQWSDQTLNEEKEMYGQMWPIATTLGLMSPTKHTTAVKSLCSCGRQALLYRAYMVRQGKNGQHLADNLRKCDIAKPILRLH